MDRDVFGNRGKGIWSVWREEKDFRACLDGFRRSEKLENQQENITRILGNKNIEEEWMI